jgi:hypothetical protein
LTMLYRLPDGTWITLADVRRIEVRPAEAHSFEQYPDRVMVVGSDAQGGWICRIQFPDLAAAEAYRDELATLVNAASEPGGAA